MHRTEKHIDNRAVRAREMYSHVVTLKLGLLVSIKGLLMEELGLVLEVNLEHSFRSENTTRVSKNRASMVEKRSL